MGWTLEKKRQHYREYHRPEAYKQARAP
jgi:hypothetical protein